jgi:hypothetical protein
VATIATSGDVSGEPRPAFGEAERVAAEELAGRLEEMGRDAAIQPFWVRPYWWASQAACAGLGVIASVVAIRGPLAGLLIAVAALLLAMADETRFAPLRRLTPARGGQNVVSRPATDPSPGGVYLVLTAAIDDRRPARSAGIARSLVLANVIALLLVAGCAGIRLAGFGGLLLDIAQLLPTLFLLALILALLDRGTATPGSDTSACEAVLELVARLDADPPDNLVVAVVLAGGGDAHAIGLRHWLTTRRRRGMNPRETAILAIEDCSEGTPIWWKRDGTVVATGLHPQLRAAASRAAAELPELCAKAVSGPDATAAGVARGARWPAIAIGARAGESPPDPAGEDQSQGGSGGGATRAPDGGGLGATEGVVSLGEAIVRELDEEIGDRKQEQVEGQSSSS